MCLILDVGETRAREIASIYDERTLRDCSARLILSLCHVFAGVVLQYLRDRERMVVAFLLDMQIGEIHKLHSVLEPSHCTQSHIRQSLYVRQDSVCSLFSK